VAQYERQGSDVNGWPYWVAVRVGLDELRKQSRREKYERLFGFGRRETDPEELQIAVQAQRHTRAVHAALPPRQAELLLLRSEGLSYQEIADALELLVRLVRFSAEHK
jgi:DNA-directed RNA polymerase specialized sigma24 family protein